MAMCAITRQLVQRAVAVSLAGIVLVGLGGCASEQPKSSGSAMTPDQVRGHADKAFGNLKQEERQRAAEPGGTSY